MSIDWNLVVFFAPFIALVTAVVALIFSILMHIRVSRIFRSANSSDIEKLLKLHSKTIEDLLKYQADSSNYMGYLDSRIKKKTTSASVTRFNPFVGEGVGGNQSFSSVFADEEGNGVVITSIHTRARTNVFAKPLKNWKSEYELTNEEKKTIEDSANRLSEKK